MWNTLMRALLCLLVLLGLAPLASAQGIIVVPRSSTCGNGIVEGGESCDLDAASGCTSLACAADCTCVTQGGALTQVVLGATTNTQGTGDSYARPFTPGVVGTDPNTIQAFTEGGTITDARIELGGTVGLDASIVVALQKGTTLGDIADTAILCTFDDVIQGITCDDADDVTFSKDDIFRIRINRVVASNARVARWAFTVQPTTSDHALYSVATISLTASEQHGPLISGAWLVGIGGLSVIPAACVVRSWHAQQLSVSGAGTSHTYTLKVNGSDTSVGCSITGASALTCDDTDFKLLALGDKAQIHHTVSGSPANAIGSVSFVCDPVTPGEFIVGSGQNLAPNGTNTNYNYASYFHQAWTITEANVLNTSAAMTIQRMYALLTIAPGSGTSRVFRLRVNSATPSPDMTCQIADTAVGCSSTSGSVAISNGDEIGVQTVPTNTPASPQSNTVNFAATVP